jgi:hypothetical protein
MHNQIKYHEGAVGWCRVQDQVKIQVRTQIGMHASNPVWTQVKDQVKAQLEEDHDDILG